MNPISDVTGSPKVTSLGGSKTVIKGLPEEDQKPKIIDSDSANFEFDQVPPPDLNEEAIVDRMLFQFDGDESGLEQSAVVSRNKKIKIQKYFSISLLQSSILDSLGIAQSSGIDLNKTTLKDIKSIINTSYKILKEKVKPTGKIPANTEFVESKIKIDGIVPFKGFIDSFKGALGIAQTQKEVDLDRLTLRDVRLILGETMKILINKSRTSSI